jgi:hypothetical protein
VRTQRELRVPSARCELVSAERKSQELPKVGDERFRVERDEPVEKPEHEARRGEDRSQEEQPCDPRARRLATCPQRHAGPIAEKRWLLRLLRLLSLRIPIRGDLKIEDVAIGSGVVAREETPSAFREQSRGVLRYWPGVS